MECKRCYHIPMVVGEAINPGYDESALYIMPVANITYKDLEIILVWKCPECGHSEFIE